MPFFIKTETFNAKMKSLTAKKKKEYILKHYEWIRDFKSDESKLSSGYLIDSDRNPGGGGLLIVQTKSFTKAKEIIIEDPMIKNDLVNWQLHEWIPIFGEGLSRMSNH